MARRKKLKKSTIIKIIVICALVLCAIAVAVVVLKKKVAEEFASSSSEYTSAQAEVSSISTTVSGSGTLADCDVEEYDIPDGIELDEVLVSSGDDVTEGDTLATINTASVLSAMYDVQEEIDDIDSQLEDASEETAATTIKAAVDGRVKVIYVEDGDDVITTMTANNALMILSMDGYMAVDIDSSTLEAGDSVQVTVSDTEYDGTVDTVVDGVATILISDKTANVDESAAVADEDGNALGSGTLYIHSPLSVVSYAGTVSSISVDVNEKVEEGDTLLKLTDTEYTANYDALLESREDLEDDLSDLIAIYRNGAIIAQMTGTVKTVPTTSDSSDSTSTSSTSSSSTTTTEDVNYFEICPNEQMTIEVSVDETDILSLSDGQSAQVTIDSLDQTVEGTITDIDKTGTTSDGVTYYTTEVTIDKGDGMLSGMSASVVISIESVDDAILIPIDALNNTGSTYFVYTTLDEESDTLGGMVEVTVGITNSTYAQITSGLAEGDTVYYTDTSSNTTMPGMQGMSGMQGGDGQMPSGDFSGGQAPSGDFSGGQMPSGGNGGSGNAGGGAPGAAASGSGN